MGVAALDLVNQPWSNGICFIVAKSTRSHWWVEGTWSKWGSKNKGLGSRRWKESCKEATHKLKPPNIKPRLTLQITTSGWIKLYLHVGTLTCDYGANSDFGIGYHDRHHQNYFRGFVICNMELGWYWAWDQLGKSWTIVIILGKWTLKSISTPKVYLLRVYQLFNKVP